MGRLVVAVAAATGAALAGPAPAAGDPDDARPVFLRRCGICHAADEAVNRIGPSLPGMFGRRSGGVAGLACSEAMAKAGVAWNEETLDAYLPDPRRYIPGVRMAIPGPKDAKDRADPIAYLREATAP
ncbi:MAG TPA: cytochrome c family protein [Geminicoccaceae bacterium]|nr:cytochrome c family protein [Geminicoccaceae bacterium]